MLLLDLLGTLQAGLMVGKVDTGQRNVVIAIGLLRCQPGFGLFGVVITRYDQITRIRQRTTNRRADTTSSTSYPGDGGLIGH